MAFDEDLSLFFDLTGFAVTATWGTNAAQVIFDMPAEDVLGARAQSTEYEVTLPTAVFPGITRGDTITISGAAAAVNGPYRLREKPRLVEDGALKSMLLERV